MSPIQNRFLRCFFRQSSDNSSTMSSASDSSASSRKRGLESSSVSSGTASNGEQDSKKPKEDSRQSFTRTSKNPVKLMVTDAFDEKVTTSFEFIFRCELGFVAIVGFKALALE